MSLNDENEVKSCAVDFQVKAKGSDMIIEGYASVFGVTDNQGDVVERGAFLSSLARKMPKMCFQHQFQGHLPGIWDEAQEDSKGLFMKGHFIDTTLGRDTYTAAKEGAIDSLSIGYTVLDYERNGDLRHLKQLALHEVSLVNFPANSAALITACKSALEITTEREFEEFLRNSGFTRAQAKAITCAGFKSSLNQRDVDDGDDKGSNQRDVELSQALGELFSEFNNLMTKGN